MVDSRRDFLKLAAAVGLGQALGPLGARLAAMGAAPLASAAAVPDYKALVFIFLIGGNDSTNMVLPTDPDSWGRYQAARNLGPSPIALAPAGTLANPKALATLGASALGGVLPITPLSDNGWPAGTVGTGRRSFALHPLLGNVQALFNQGKIAIVPNVGPLIVPTTKAAYAVGAVPLPRNLFSHIDQVLMWQEAGGTGAQGWGGLMADLVGAQNQNGVFTSISMTGGAALLAGNSSSGYEADPASGAVLIKGLQSGPLFGSASAGTTLRNIITPADSQHLSLFQQNYARTTGRSISAASTLEAALAAVTHAPAPPAFTAPGSVITVSNTLSSWLQGVANLVSAGQLMGMKRQIFFLARGGYDTHASQNAYHPFMMAELDSALGYFYQTLGSLNGIDMTSKVTTCTLSEFGRTFTTNGTGTDHGWGSHHLVMGGAVKGGDIYGQFPTVGEDLGAFSNPIGIQNGVSIPQLSVDQYAATLGLWFGIAASDLMTIFPNLGNFVTPSSISLGFI